MLLASVSTIGCSTDGEPREDEEVVESELDEDRPADSETEIAAATGVDVPEDEVDEPADEPDEDDCLGTRQPPRGAEGTAYLQEQQIARDKTVQKLEQQAREELRDRVCQGVLCDAVEQQIDIWETNDTGTYRCAMAVVQRAELEEWKRRVQTDIGDRIIQQGSNTVETLREATEQEEPRIAVGDVYDDGVPGGRRAEWVAGRFRYALDRLGATIVSNIEDAESVVEAELQQVRDERMELTWEVHHEDWITPGDPVEFPEVAAPDMSDADGLPRLDLESNKLRLHLEDSRDGGGLCHGQRSRLLLETEQNMHVRVLNLFGNRGGRVIYPAHPEEDDFVEAGEPVSLGEFQAIRSGDNDIERFVVIASTDREGLGRFASVDRFCRLPGTMAHNIQFGREAPVPGGDNVHFEATGFRLMDGEGCESYHISEREEKQLGKIIAQAPGCW